MGLTFLDTGINRSTKMDDGGGDIRGGGDVFVVLEGVTRRVCYVEMTGRLRGVRWWWRLYLVVDGVSSGGRKVAGNARGEVGDEDVTNDESTLKKSY